MSNDTHKEINVREEIMTAITAADDPKDRAFLALLGRVLDRMEHLLTDVMNAEKVRLMALNGEAPFHAEDHDLVSTLREKKVEAAIDWVNGRIAHQGHCKFANEAMQAEKETKLTVKEYWGNFVGSIIKELPKAIFYGALLLAGYKVLG
jgi:hypothetical protein